jgi:hypothetical protein
LVNCIKKNLATLPEINSLRKMHSTDSFRWTQANPAGSHHGNSEVGKLT